MMYMLKKSNVFNEYRIIPYYLLLMLIFGGDEMLSCEKVTIRMLTVEDYLIIEQCLRGITDLMGTDLFVAPTSDYIYKIISGYGYTAGAFCGCLFAGFASVVFPKRSNHNIGHLLHFNDEQLLAVAQLEHIYVVPEYRSKGIAEQLVNYLLSKIDPKYTILLSTVAPHNTPSLSLAFKIGQRIVSYSVIYGVNRYILYRKYEFQNVNPEWMVTEISKKEICKIDLLLKAGFEGVSFGSNKSTLRLILRREIP